MRVTVAQAFTGKLALLQRYRGAVKRWATVKRVKLGIAKPAAAGAVVTAASFHARVRRGWRVRTLLTPAQAVRPLRRARATRYASAEGRSARQR